MAEATLNETIVTDQIGKNKNDLQTSLLEIVKEATERVNYAIDYVSKSDINTFENQIMNTTQYGEPLLRFALTVIISLGAIFKLCYQTYGMTSLPIFLIKGTRSLEDENDEIQGSIGSVREQLRAIQEKYARNQKSHISAKDKILLKKLRKEEKILGKKSLQITSII